MDCIPESVQVAGEVVQSPLPSVKVLPTPLKETVPVLDPILMEPADKTSGVMAAQTIIEAIFICLHCAFDNYWQLGW
jgi:hypothetical protein